MAREEESFIDVIPNSSAEMVLEGAGVDGEVARRDLERCYHVRGASRLSRAEQAMRGAL